MNPTGPKPQNLDDKDKLFELSKTWDFRTKFSSKKEEKEAKGPRWFTKQIKDRCWKNAKPIPERSPERWRLDALGNPVFHAMRGCDGPLCYDFDHIIPLSKGGKTDVDNCQVLQKLAYLYKMNKPNASLSELKSVSFQPTLTEHEMDLIELAAFGNIMKFKKEEQSSSTGAEEIQAQSQSQDAPSKRRYRGRSPEKGKGSENPQESSPSG